MGLFRSDIFISHRDLSRRAPISLALFASCLALGACGGGGSGDGPSGGLDFSAVEEFLPGWEFDTGFIPEGEQVQVRAVARAGGTLSAQAAGEVDADGNLVPIAGSGLISIDAGLEFELHANIDVTGATYNGLIESFRYEIPATETTFEPFLLDSEATLSAPLPAQEIATVPVPSVPGASIVLSVEGGQIDVALRGTCAASRDGAAQFTGRWFVGGQLELAATVVIEIPIVGTKEFGPFAIPVDLPSMDTAADLGVFAADGSGFEGKAPCAEGQPAGNDGDSDGDGPVDSDDDGPDSDGNGPGDDVVAPGAECATYEMFKWGTCVPDPDHWWRVRIDSAFITARTDAGLVWDGGLTYEQQRPDPYLVITTSNDEHQTRPLNNTHIPDWGDDTYVVETAKSLKLRLDLALYDDDAVVDDEIASCNHRLRDSDFRLGRRLNAADRYEDCPQVKFTLMPL